MVSARQTDTHFTGKRVYVTVLSICQVSFGCECFPRGRLGGGGQGGSHEPSWACHAGWFVGISRIVAGDKTPCIRPTNRSSSTHSVCACSCSQSYSIDNARKSEFSTECLHFQHKYAIYYLEGIHVSKSYRRNAVLLQWRILVTQILKYVHVGNLM